MDPFRYRKAYEAMVHTTQLIEERLNQDVQLNEEGAVQDDAPQIPSTWWWQWGSPG